MACTRKTSIRFTTAMLNNQQLSELRAFLNRLQGKEVRVEISSRLNIAMRQSFALIVEAANDNYSFVSESGEISIFFDPEESEAFSSDASSITLMYGDNLFCIRHARSR